MFLHELLLLLLLQVTLIDAVHLCPLLGPSWPAPTGLSSDATVQAALKNITQTLQDVSNAGKFSGASLSLEIFDTSSSDALLTYAYTAKEINTTLGVSKVDENTVFRIGSTSKMFPMFLILIQSGFKTLQDPISKYIPEIKAAAADIQRNSTKRNNGNDYTNWDDITVGELASHLAEFFDGLFQSHPIVPPSSTPIYSNAAFQILGYVVEALAGGEDFEKVLKHKITKPLNMAHTFYTTPSSSLGVIPSYQGEYWWDFDIGEEAPAGGIFSSAKDMSTFGRAILNSTLLPRSTTRRWLKPLTHTSSLDYAVGAPWEILSFGNERPIDLYTKSGDIGTYSCVLSLDPDHNAGFVLLGAGNSTHVSLALASDLVAESLLPALEQAAKNQAHARFAGTYALGTGNSSITITTDDGPALVVTSWVNNGTNMLQSYMALNGITDPSMLDIRLYPTGLESPGQLSFRAVIPPPLPSGVGPFSSSCISWVTLDSRVYGNVGIDEFVFNLDGKGNVVSVSPRVLRTVLSNVN
ncbi:Beta-lactamase-like protein [Penicillium subrubescens]|uniref:Beta-lactamase-like protein n=1 Tax=Penicillium subrubescens TaxID=1316194 RepID=A0A1Q5UET7_9EURO|nr:Beta-lactamase-like protein [Penicillium subrubescens]